MTFLGLGPADFVVELTRFSYDRNGTVLEVTVNAFPADGIRLVYEWSAS
jgi:DNA-binding GntR family transcriptional regulator